MTLGGEFTGGEVTVNRYHLLFFTERANSSNT